MRNELFVSEMQCGGDRRGKTGTRHSSEGEAGT